MQGTHRHQALAVMNNHATYHTWNPDMGNLISA
jgi:hypothetical protein